MPQRIEFRFGKNSAFQCETAQILRADGETLGQALTMNRWVIVQSSSGTTRMINMALVTQIEIGLPDSKQPEDVPTARG